MFLEASSGEEALALLTGPQAIDLAFLDEHYGSSPLTGTFVTQTARDRLRQQGRRLPIIFGWTADWNSESLRHAQEAGQTALLMKPLSQDLDTSSGSLRSVISDHLCSQQGVS